MTIAVARNARASSSPYVRATSDGSLKSVGITILSSAIIAASSVSDTTAGASTSVPRRLVLFGLSSTDGLDGVHACRHVVRPPRSPRRCIGEMAGAYGSSAGRGYREVGITGPIETADQRASGADDLVVRVDGTAAAAMVADHASGKPTFLHDTSP